MKRDPHTGAGAAARFATAVLGGAVLALIVLLTPSCGSTQEATQAQVPIWPGLGYRIHLPVSHPPYDTVHVSWRVPLEEGYVFLDHYGSYTDTPAHLPALLREMRVQGIEPSGPPFCLYYDDPATTPRDQRRSRACVPIKGIRSPRTPLAYDVLPPVSIAEAFVSGPYPDVKRAYPKINEWMASKNWVRNGPIREHYIVPPSQATRSSDYLCLIQIPGTNAE